MRVKLASQELGQQKEGRIRQPEAELHTQHEHEWPAEQALGIEAQCGRRGRRRPAGSRNVQSDSPSSRLLVLELVARAGVTQSDQAVAQQREQLSKRIVARERR